ncbi:MAG: thermonuclease family protein [Leptospiraceae bacterium]|nr:thermonuclease family protein [Leptospiraceae bacterium]
MRHTKTRKKNSTNLNKSLILKKVFFLAVLLTFVINTDSVLSQETLLATVVKVVDGDTLRIQGKSVPPTARRYKDGTLGVRLKGIDAPELTQPYGRESKTNLEKLILGKTVIIHISDLDRYGRIVGYVFFNGKNINLEQVKSGYAWAYIEYLERPYISEFYEAEKNARDKKIGIWKNPNPIPPWEYRKRR